jgi:hypothetical protein
VHRKVKHINMIAILKMIRVELRYVDEIYFSINISSRYCEPIPKRRMMEKMERKDCQWNLEQKMELRVKMDAMKMLINPHVAIVFMRLL